MMNVFNQMSGITQAQQAALNSYSQLNVQANCYSPPREMTAADLSLVQCSERNYIIVCPPEMTPADLGLDPPYSFWLGAGA